MTTFLYFLLQHIYIEHKVVPSDNLLVPSLLQNPGHNKKPSQGYCISGGIQILEEVAACNLPIME